MDRTVEVADMVDRIREMITGMMIVRGMIVVDGEEEGVGMVVDMEGAEMGEGQVITRMTIVEG